MTPVWGADEAVAAWVAAQIGMSRGFLKPRSLGVFDARGQIAAGVVFHDWNPEQSLIELSAAATDRRWLTRSVAQAAFGYAFGIARMAVTRTRETNRPVRRIWRALGASEHVIPQMWADDEAMILFTLRPEQWRASRLGGNHG